ncbi:MAG: tRNA (adenosine(37)-N6)-dimethylallyltransferase MiaA, partial [Patescibacteria group bacterium]|nr:tRNA (adenosine(37)-N6)-dimethylallyltransferase MiaA [Patescibacteria group bacterium]
IALIVVVIAIVGPTATGKTDLALKLAKKYNGEIISADSRAIYKGLNIGTAKPSRDLHYSKIDGRQKLKIYLHSGVRFHLVDFLSPKKIFSAADFAKRASSAIADILARGKLPIVCGGTGFWLDALLNPQLLSDVPPNPKLRKNFAKLTTETLLNRLKKLDPKRAETIDPNNRRRLTRAIEIASFTKDKKVSSHVILNLIRNPNQRRLDPDFHQDDKKRQDVLFLGLTLSNPELKKRIKMRFLKWLKTGLLTETEKLTQAVSKKRLKEIGLAYPIVAVYLDKKISRAEMLERSVSAIYHYAKRQKTWFTRNKQIRWITPRPQHVRKLVDEFFKN